MANSWNGVRASEPRCASCGSVNVMTIRLVHDDQPVSVLYCSECENREWIKDGEPVGIDNVIPAPHISKRPRRR